MKKILILFTLFFLPFTTANCQTIQDVKDLISTNLATGTKITAIKHREVENSIVSLIENKIFLYKGSYTIGNIVASDESRTITFPTVGTSNYLVVGSLVSNGVDYNFDNDVVWTIKGKSNTQFSLLLRALAEQAENLTFNYVLIPY